jgi:hypothetical protein
MNHRQENTMEYLVSLNFDIFDYRKGQGSGVLSGWPERSKPVQLN